MEKEILPVFEGATHRIAGSGEPVKAVRWAKDGDHPLVERYPIERREYKGLLVAGPKEKFGLRFGDWVVEDADGRLYAVPGAPREVEELVEESPGLFRKAMRKLPSMFEEQYVPLDPEEAPWLAAAVAVLVAALCGLLSDDSGKLPLFFAVTHLMYYRALLGQWNGLANSVFDLDTDTIKVSAHTNTYAPNQDTNEFFSDATNEVSGTNYTAGGAMLASPTVTRSTGTITFDANDVVWTQSGAGFSTARKFVVYRSTGTGTTSKLFSVVTADGDVGNVTGDLTIQWNASGIATWSTT